MDDNLPNLIWILMALVLVGSSLSLRRLPTSGLVKLVLIWVAIFAGVFLLMRLVTGYN